MRDRMLPELLRVHLTLAVLKLYEFGVEDVLEFEFVEQPDPSTLREAVKILKFVDAVSDTGLTDRGKILATLPIDPQLGKVLLDGIEAGIGLEAAIVVATSAVGGGIFFRAGTDAEKAASDKKKLQFSHEAGDQMTCLCVYWNWVSQNKEARNQWCFANSINAKSMRRVEETVKELQKIVLIHAMKIPTTVKDLKNAQAYFPKLFFFSFLNHIAVFTGHERAGYILTENQNDPSFIFPGSVLSSQNLVPQYLVYEKILKTSRQFLLQVMPVKPEWVNEAVSIGKLPIDPAERFREYMISAVSLTNIGWQVFKKAYIDSDKIKQELKEACQNSPHSVDTSTTKISGVVKVYTQPRYHEHARSLLEKRFNDIRKELMKEQHELGVTTESDDVRLVLGHGGQIQYVLMPGDCMTVIIKGPLKTEWTTGVLTELACLGDICSITCRSFKKDHRMYIKFYDPKDAANTVAVLSQCHGTDEDEDGVTVDLSKKHMGNQCVTTLKVEWCRRMRQKFAFITFENPMDATRLVLHAHPYYRFKRDKDAYPSQPSFKVFVTNVPITHTEEDLEYAVNYRLSSDSVAPNSKFTIQLGYQKAFSTSPEEVYHLKCQLKTLVDKYTQSNKYEVKMISPQDHYKTYRAFVNIKDVAESQKIFSGLVKEEINSHPLIIKPHLSSIVIFSYKVFPAIKADVEKVEVALNQRYESILSIKKVINNTNIKYELISEDMQAYIDAKQMLNTTTLPTIKDCRSQPVLRQFVLSSYCQEIMNDIQQRTSTVIIINKWMLTISVYGVKETKAEAIKLIEDHLDKLLESGVQSYDIPLKKPGGPPGLMKHVVSQFGLDLEKLVQREGISGAALNVNKHVLSVSSTPEAYKSLFEEIESFTSSAIHPAQNHEAVECCGCWTELDSESEVFRLQYCGHSYCIECIQIQVTSPTAVFPVQCAADQCSQPLVVQDFNALCRRVSYTMQQLCEASLRSYISVNPDRVRNCCTPDCKMIYTVSEVGEKFFCSLCGVSICTKCHVQYHDNLTCAMYQSLKREDPDIHKWIMEDSENRKCCPKCTVGIEKTGGCNHISCRCGVHICWVCLEYFDSPQRCYDHLQASHGSFV